MDVGLSDITIHSLWKETYPNKSELEKGRFMDFCSEVGIGRPAQLTVLSKRAMEEQLIGQPTEHFLKLMELREAYSKLERQHKGKDGGQSARETDRGERRDRSVCGSKRGCLRRRSLRGRSRSRAKSRSPGGRRGRYGKGGRPKGRRRKSSRLQGHGQARAQPPPPKPKLWAAIEAGDEAETLNFLRMQEDPEERFQGWTPLMKAAEEGHVRIINLLLEQQVDIEATNRKGRTALSFAAAPSMKGTEKRETPVDALRLLLHNHADATHKDQEGLTAKARAAREKRTEAVEVFEEFE